jgi:signal transduction histidine kinase
MAGTHSPSETILVVDDNAANRALAQGALEDEGYRVVLASGGEEGVETFQREKPDCVVMDVRMPGLDGFGACERIRGLPGGPETPVVFLTALRDIDTFDRALRAGGDDFLTKPVRPTELVIRVQTALKLRRLSAEVREHYDLLKGQRDALLRLQLQKERLTAFVVHDLKNPVAAMDLNAQLLARNAALPEDARGPVTEIRAAARRLGRMILNLLDLSKGDEGKLVARRTAVDVPDLVGRVVREMDAAARDRGVALEIDVHVERLQADADLLERALVNLVENAVRHAPRGTAVVVCVDRGENASELRVSDAGKGIPEAQRASIFDPFVQLEGQGSSNRAGRGLGLAFCRLVAEAHGGQIEVEDAAPGAAFVLTIPDQA